MTRTVYVNIYQLLYNKNHPRAIIGKKMSYVAPLSDPETTTLRDKAPCYYNNAEAEGTRS